MRIYRVNTEHWRYGQNFSHMKILAKTCEEAIKRAKRKMQNGERVESVELLASTD